MNWVYLLCERRPEAEWLSVLVATAGFVSSAAGRPAKAGAYTHEQRARGAIVYKQPCAQRHGSDLEGQTGPSPS